MHNEVERRPLLHSVRLLLGLCWGSEGGISAGGDIWELTPGV